MYYLCDVYCFCGVCHVCDVCMYVICVIYMYESCMFNTCFGGHQSAMMVYKLLEIKKVVFAL